MKKVGIMTWYQHKNYGTTLQAAALVQVVKNLGYEVYGIDYYSKGYDRETFLEKILSFQRIKEGVHNSLYIKKYGRSIDPKRDSRFNCFIESYIPMTQKAQTSSQLYRLNDYFDAFICGSDQIWSPNEFNSKYYLDFVSDDEKKIAYAPSFGVCQITCSYIKDEIGKHVAKIKNLSVREEHAKKMLSDYYGIESEIVLDPTLLLNSTQWNCFASSEHYENKSFLLCYFLGENENYWGVVEKIAKDYQLEICIIPVHSKDYLRDYTILNGVGPSEFISSIKRAKIVCTDSFHGTVFSIIYNKEFLVFNRFDDRNPKSQNSRIHSILSILDLRERLYQGNIPRFSNYQWDSVNEKLELLRKESKSFLENSLSSATSHRNVGKPITNTCCGCGICMYVCPREAISMKVVDGFYRAQLNLSQCVDCGLCVKVCSFNGDTGRDLNEGALFECKSKDKSVLLKSTSGGISHELQCHFNDKGPVYACEYDYDNNAPMHSLTEQKKISDLSKYQGSKYIQSNFFKNVDYLLGNGQGLVVGTPCQIASLHNLMQLKGNRLDYILVDLICHGVPSKLLWEKYRKELLGDERLIEVRFRNPEKGWRNKSIYIKSNTMEYSKKETFDLFYSYFDLQNCYMPSCYECNYRVSSNADLRLGDYWGKRYTKEDLIYGTSMVVAMTPNGESILKELKDLNKISLEKKPMEDYYYGQGPENPIIPAYYSHLINLLESSKMTLIEIRKELFNVKYWNQRLQFLAAKILKR